MKNIGRRLGQETYEGHPAGAKDFSYFTVDREAVLWTNKFDGIKEFM